MKWFLLLILVVSAFFAHAQQEIKGRSNVQGFSISKDPPKPPLLVMVPGSLKFTDVDKNNNIDANEACRIEFDVENQGYGDGIGLFLNVSLQSPVSYLTFDKRQALPKIPVKGKQHVIIPVTAGMDLKDGKATFVVSIEEPNGFNMDPAEMEVNIRAFVSPLVKVTDYTITGDNSTTLLRKRPFDLQVLVQNTKPGKAEDVKVSLELPDNVQLLTDNRQQQFIKLDAGETKSLVYTLIVSDKFIANEIPLKVNISEKYNRFSENRTINASINQSIAGNKIVVTGSDYTPPPDITIATLTSDVDREIPVVGKTFSNRYALVIGNEDYATFQSGLQKESNVDYAIADARSFADYAEKVLGIEKGKVKLLTNAQDYMIKQELDRLDNIVKTRNGDAELFIYYSGHGLPDVNGETYLMPVNVSAVNVQAAGISLNSFYSKLIENNPVRVTVFLDACFSGAGRNEGLLAAKSARIKPQKTAVNGNMIVYSSCTDEQKSQFDERLKHGVFTYFLLKYLKDTKGQITYGDLSQSLNRDVPLYLLEHSKESQNPQVLYSPVNGNVWESWKFIK